MRAVLRYLVWLPLVYGMACLAAGYTAYGAALSTDRIAEWGQVPLLWGGMFMAALFGTFGALPTMLAVLCLEWKRVASPLAYLVLGCALGVVIAALPIYGVDADLYAEPFLSSLPNTYDIYLTGGAAWGAVWWILAGREAGI